VPNCRRQKGLSLSEVIVVIAIVVIVIALIATIALSVRRQSYLVGCASNLRQIAAAIHMYVADHEQLPPSWYLYIEPYLGDSRVLICPADRLAVPLQKLASSYTYSDPESYYRATSFYMQQPRYHNSIQMDPNFVMVSCDHHLDWRIIFTNSPSNAFPSYDTSEMPPRTFIQVLRYNGAVNRVHLCDIRRIWGVDSPGLRVFFAVYPGMEDYAYGTGFYYDLPCNQEAR